ncbi:hypothetical protein ACFTAO_26830 [Paenibacillus rhizoplanae]
MLPWLITILLAVTLIVVAAFLLMDKIFPGDGNEVSKAVQNVETKKMTADEIVEMTAEIQDIKTNLADPDYILSVDIALQLDSAASKEEFEKIKSIKNNTADYQSYCRCQTRGAEWGQRQRSVQQQAGEHHQ